MSDQLSIEIKNNLSQFSTQQLKQWKALNLDQNPFCDPSFFDALEQSNCIGQESGWNPLYFCLIQGHNLLGLIIGFVKTNSYGEYIFDWQWANAYQEYQIPYYPKFTVAIPYSPVSCPKLLGDQMLIDQYLLPQVLKFTTEHGLSGVHFLFTDEHENRILEKRNFKKRSSLQYHWINPQINSFSSYLETLKKNRRKTIKRERRIISESKLHIARLSGSEITPKDISFFYECYSDTIDKKSSLGYLNHDFFKKIFQSLSHRITLCMAYSEVTKTPIAASFFINSDTTLYGRYWGCKKEIDFLHFELCIYQGIELAIEKGLSTFEAGAQGEHKRLRGFTPILTTSAHHIEHPQFREAIYDFINNEEAQLNQIKEQLTAQNSLKTIV